MCKDSVVFIFLRRRGGRGILGSFCSCPTKQQSKRPQRFRTPMVSLTAREYVRFWGEEGPL